MIYDIKKLSQQNKDAMVGWIMRAIPSFYERESLHASLREMLVRDVRSALPDDIKALVDSDLSAHLVSRYPLVFSKHLFFAEELTAAGLSGKIVIISADVSVAGFCVPTSDNRYGPNDEDVSNVVRDMVSDEFRSLAINYLRTFEFYDSEVDAIKSIVADCSSLRALLNRAPTRFAPLIHFWAETKYRTGRSPTAEATNASFAP